MSIGRRGLLCGVARKVKPIRLRTCPVMFRWGSTAESRPGGHVCQLGNVVYCVVCGVARKVKPIRLRTCPVMLRWGSTAESRPGRNVCQLGNVVYRVVWHGKSNPFACALALLCSGGAARLNHGLADTVINWAGGLHHAKKSEVRGLGSGMQTDFIGIL